VTDVSCSAARDLGPRDAIIAAGHRLVGNKQSNFTIVELSAEAGIALQTFYRYFRGKDHLLVALIADQICAHTDRLRVSLAETPDPVERLRECIRATVAPAHSSERARARLVATEHWRLHAIIPEELAGATKPFVDLIAEQLQAGFESGQLRPRDVEQDAWLVTRTVMSTVHHYVFTPDAPGEDISEALCEFCVTAVGGGG
jgi:TetR/AcrR family transcriptional regulator